MVNMQKHCLHNPTNYNHKTSTHPKRFLLLIALIFSITPLQAMRLLDIGRMRMTMPSQSKFTTRRLPQRLMSTPSSQEQITTPEDPYPYAYYRGGVKYTIDTPQDAGEFHNFIVMVRQLEATTQDSNTTISNEKKDALRMHLFRERTRLLLNLGIMNKGKQG